MRFAHNRMPARRRFLVLAAAVAAMAAVLTIFSSPASGATADSIAVDTDIAGNTASSLGALDECTQVSAGTSVVVDVTVTDVPSGTDAIVGYTFKMTYNPAVVTVTAKDDMGLLSTNPDYTAFDAGDSVPDADGEFLASIADLSPTAGVSGSGFLMRLTLEIAAAASGGAGLDLTVASTINMQNLESDVPRFGGRLAIGQTCESLPTFKQGDVDCSDAVNAVDALKVLRFVAGLSVAQTEPCDNIGTGAPPQGDVDCSGAVNAVDALKVLRFVAGLSVAQTEPCRDIGT